MQAEESLRLATIMSLSQIGMTASGQRQRRRIIEGWQRAAGIEPVPKRALSRDEMLMRSRIG
jgi:hypothetical protein